MFTLLSVIMVCVTIIVSIKLLQEKPINVVIHKKLEEIIPEEKPLTDAEQKALEDQEKTIDGMNEVIKFAQEFLGGEVEDAATKHETE